MMALNKLCVIALRYHNCLSEIWCMSFHLNGPCSVLAGCTFSICCTFASTHIFFGIFSFLCSSSVQTQPTRNWCSHTAESRRRWVWCRCAFSRGRTAGLVFMTDCFSVKSHMQKNENSRLYVMVEIGLRFNVWHHHAMNPAVTGLQCSFYDVLLCTGALLQLFAETDVVMVYKGFWQGALFPVVPPHRGHNVLAYSWCLIRAQVDQTLLHF